MYLLEPEPKYGASCKPQNMIPSCFSLALALYFRHTYSQFEPYSLNPKTQAGWQWVEAGSCLIILSLCHSHANLRVYGTNQD